LSFGIVHARNSQAFIAANPGILNAETVYEITYLVEIYSWLSSQADYQYIANPGTNPSLDDAQIFGIRTHIQLF